MGFWNLSVLLADGIDAVTPAETTRLYSRRRFDSAYPIEHGFAD